MSFWQAFTSMASIFFAVLIGYAANKLGYMGGDFDKKLTALILNLTTPCMIVASVLTREDFPLLKDILSILFIILVYYVVSFICALVFPILLKTPKSQVGILQYALFLANTGGVGYPIVTALFGADWAFYVAIISLPTSILAFTVGVSMITRSHNKIPWKTMLSPCTIASLLALAITVFHIRVPATIVSCIDFVGDSCVPMTIILLGSIFAELPLQKAFSSIRIWLFAVIRLFAMPAVLYGILYLIGIDPLMRNIAVILMGLPAASNSALFTIQYGGDIDFAAQTVFLSTAVSVFTIPILAALIL